MENNTPEIKDEFTAEEMAAKDGSKDLRTIMYEYAKRMNGYDYISASRIERMPEKNEKSSILFQQLYFVYLAKKQTEQDFMETFANGRLIFIQAHQECPTLAADGCYDQISITGQHIKTQIGSHFVIDVPDPAETKDEMSQKDMAYFYKDPNNGMFVDVEVNEGVPLAEYYKKHTTLYSRLKKPAFTPCIMVKHSKDKYGMIYGNPYHQFTTAEAAAILKEGGIVSVPMKEKPPAEEPPAK